MEAALACDPAAGGLGDSGGPRTGRSRGPLPALVAWLAPRIAAAFGQLAGNASGAGWDAARQSEPNLAADAGRGARRSAAIADRNRQFIELAAGAVEWLMHSGTPLPDRHEADRIAARLAGSERWHNARSKLPALAQARRTGDRAAGEPSAPRERGPGGSQRLAAPHRAAGRVGNQLCRRGGARKAGGLKEFAYGAGHEINNPLANISARAQTLLKDEHDPERRQKLAAINTQAFRAHEMIADLMLFAQPPEWKPDRVAIGPLLAELESAWRRQAADQQTVFYVRIADESLAAWADRGALAVALRALVANALEALGRGGTVELAVTPAGLAKKLLPAIRSQRHGNDRSSDHRGGSRRRGDLRAQ